MRTAVRGTASWLGGVFLLMTIPAPAAACTASHTPGELSRQQALLKSERPIGLAGGIGDLRFPTGSASPAAAAYLDQGLAYLYSYAWWPAARSFRQALREDRELAMAHWGLAEAFHHLRVETLAEEHATAAEELVRESAPLPGERRWIELGLRRFAALAAPRVERPHRLEALRADLDAWLAEGALGEDLRPFARLLRGLVEESNPLGQGQEGGEASLPLYRKALEEASEFFPAHHFLAHSLENLGRYEEAEAHARRYRELAPAAPHAHHMHGHLLPALGRWQEARTAFRQADRLHLEAAQETSALPFEDWHFAHNRRFLALAELALGDRAAAEQHLRSISRLPEDDGRAALYCTPWVELLLFEGRFDEALRAAGDCARGPSLGGAAVGHALGAEAALWSGRIGEAEGLLTRAERARRELREVPPDRATGALRSLVFAYARQLAVTAEAQLALLRSPSDGNRRRLRTLAELWTADPRFDGWSQAVLLRLPRLEAFAAEHGHARLAADLGRLYRGKVKLSTREVGDP